MGLNVYNFLSVQFTEDYSKCSLVMESTKINNNTTSVLNLVTTRWEETETTMETFMIEVESYIIFKIGNFIDTYYYPVFIPVALIGNTLSFLIMTKQNNRKMSTCIYMAAISSNDNLMTYMNCHDYLVVVVQIHTWYQLECKFLAFVALFALQNSTFLVVAMTIDKYIAIKWPHKAATYSTPKRAKMIVVAVYACAFVFNIPHLFLSSVIGGQCINFGISSVFSKMYSWFSFILNAIIPFTLLIYMNFVIVKAVRSSHKMFRANHGPVRGGRGEGLEARQRTMKSAENQLTIMLLLVTTLFLILLCPAYIRFIYMTFVQADTPLKYANSIFLFQITALLYISNSGINFFLYCISGQKFRNDLKDLLCCSGIRRKDQFHSTAVGITLDSSLKC